MLFIGAQVLWDIMRVSDSCPDDAVSAKRLLDSVPIHRIFAEHMAQCPERHVELSQEKRLLDFTHDTGHIRHDERGPDRVGNTADVNAPDGDRLFFGVVDVFHPIPFADFRRKEFRERSNTFIDALSETLGILDVGAINFLRKRYAYGSIVAGSGF